MNSRIRGNSSNLGLVLLMAIGCLCPQIHAEDEVVSDEILAKFKQA